MTGERCTAERLHAKRLKKYGHTPETWEAAIKSQSNLCLVCKRPLGPRVPKGEESGMAPVQDHDHSSGKNRGIVHRKCNAILGLAGDDPALLRMAADYLDLYSG